MPLGAMLTPLGGSVKDGRGARVVANDEKDVTAVGIAPVVPPVKLEGIVVEGVAVVPTVEAKDVAPVISDGVSEAPRVEFVNVAVDGMDGVPAAALVEVAVGPGSVSISVVEVISDAIDDMWIDPVVEVDRPGS